MTDNEKITFLQEQNKAILDKLNILEEAIKMLLVNDVLKDAENLTGQDKNSALQGELQQKIDELQKMLEAKNSEFNRLQSQLENQKSRIKTLQELSDSKDRTIQTKEEWIQILQKTVQDFNNQPLKNIELEKKRKQCIGKLCSFPYTKETFHKDNKGRFIPDAFIPGNAKNRTYEIIEYSESGNGMFYIFSEGRKVDFGFWIPAENFNIEAILKG